MTSDLNPKTPIAIAILGAGRWGRHLIRNFHHIPEAQLLAVIDPDQSQRSAVMAEVGVGDTVVGCESWAEFCEREDLADQRDRLDAIVLATPATAHYTTIVDALQRGYHVLCEKPLTLDYGECRHLCDLAQQHQRQLCIDHTYLFNPAVQRGAELIREGAIGDPRYGYAARVHLAPVRRDVDVIWDLVIHDISILNHWLGETPQRLSAIGLAHLQPTTPDFAPPDLFPQGLADVGFVRLVYPSGVTVQVHLSWFNPDKQRRLGLVGHRGTLVFDELAASPLTLYSGQMEQQPSGLWEPVNQAIEPIALAAAEPLRSVCSHFLACIRDDRPSDISSGLVGAELVRVLQAISRSVNADGAWIEVASIVA
jgi:predicted dehydrogenase